LNFLHDLRRWRGALLLHTSSQSTAETTAEAPTQAATAAKATWPARVKLGAEPNATTLTGLWRRGQILGRACLSKATQLMALIR